MTKVDIVVLIRTSSVFRFCKIGSYFLWKSKFYRVYIRNSAFGLLQSGNKLEKWQWHHNFMTWRHRQLFFELVLFLLSSLVTVPSFTSISSLVLELWQFSFIRVWQKIWKLEIHPSECCPISGEWGELEMPNLAQMFLMKCYWMLQNVMVTVFTLSELPPPPPTD